MNEKITGPRKSLRPEDITPETKIGTMLEKVPELEEVLIKMAPSFSKLRNPVLRKTVAKVATLRQIAQVGGVPLSDLINTLREATGLEGETRDEETKHAADSSEAPEWFSSDSVVRSFDARPVLDAGGQPVKQVMNQLTELKEGEIFELITPFLPAPIIDMAGKKGYAAWSTEEVNRVVRTYFTHFPETVS